MLSFMVWLTTLILLLSVIGSIIKLTQEGFSLVEFLNLVVIMFVLVIMGTIAFTGQFVM